MEILDYLRIARRRMALIVLVPVLAAAATAALILLQPTRYVATATVDSPAIVGSSGSRYTGSQGVNQYVSTFLTMATGPAVRDQVAEETGVSSAAIERGLAVTQQGASSGMVVSYTNRNRDVVSPVVENITRLTLTSMFTSQVDAETARVESARAAVAASNAKIAEFAAETGMSDPERAYEAQLNQVNALVQQQASLVANGNSVGAAAMNDSIAAAREALKRYEPLLPQFSNLTVDRDAAMAGLSDAQNALAEAKAQLGAAAPEKVMYVSDAQAVSKVQPLLRTVLPVTAAALFLTLLLVAVLEVVGRQRAEEAANAAATGEASAPVPAAELAPSKSGARSPRSPLTRFTSRPDVTRHPKAPEPPEASERRRAARARNEPVASGGTAQVGDAAAVAAPVSQSTPATSSAPATGSAPATSSESTAARAQTPPASAAGEPSPTEAAPSEATATDATPSGAAPTDDATSTEATPSEAAPTDDATSTDATSDARPSSATPTEDVLPSTTALTYEPVLFKAFRDQRRRQPVGGTPSPEPVRGTPAGQATQPAPEEPSGRATDGLQTADQATADQTTADQATSDRPTDQPTDRPTDQPTDRSTDRPTVDQAPEPVSTGVADDRADDRPAVAEQTETRAGDTDRSADGQEPVGASTARSWIKLRDRG